MTRSKQQNPQKSCW